MLHRLKRLFDVPETRRAAHDAYIALIAQSRKVFFYESAGVPDTLDGRFEVILLHLSLVLARLQQDGGAEAREFHRVLTEVYIADMDRNLREMGVTDTGVGRRVQKMASAFYGRLKAYEAALLGNEGWEAALRRNVYGTVENPSPQSLALLTAYAEKQAKAILALSVEKIIKGELRFAE